MDNKFQMVGIKPSYTPPIQIKKRRLRGAPWVSIGILLGIIIACLLCNLIMTKNPTFLDLKNYAHTPDKEFLFGTDTMGRDIFSMIWYGGRISLFIGFVATFISSIIAIVFGSVSGSGPKWLDTLMMRFTEIFLSIPSLLLVILLLAIMGKSNIFTIAVVIGVTSWASIAKIVRTEVRQMRNSDYVIASKCMGGKFFHILKTHFAPNFASSIMFMIVMNVRAAIVAESTLSFMGMGLPIEEVSWGSMLSLADKAMMTNAWWIIIIPGIFLVTTLMCLTNIGNYLRKSINLKQSNL